MAEKISGLRLVFKNSSEILNFSKNSFSSWLISKIFIFSKFDSCNIFKNPESLCPIIIFSFSDKLSIHLSKVCPTIPSYPK